MGEITEIVAIVDRSGSMADVLDDAIGGFNTFIEAQKKVDGKANFTLIQFNHGYQVVCNGIDIKDAMKYDRRTYIPSGDTALLDAVGKGISELTARTSGQNNRVLMAILTDGHENASHEYTINTIKSLIEQRKREGWEFIFLAAGVDQFDTEHFVSRMGITKDKLQVIAEKHKIAEAYEDISNAAIEYRLTGRLKEEEWKKKINRINK
jgi:Mg-chelatase subunit ChlD